MRGTVALAVMALFAGAALPLAGCSPKSDSPDGGSTGAPAAPHGSLAECLRANGVSESAGPVVLGPPAGVDPATWEQAMKACADLAPGPAAP